MRVSLAATVLVFGVATGCALVMPVPDEAVSIENLDLEPLPGSLEAPMEPPSGPVIEVARGSVAGEHFSVTVFSSRHGVCTWMERGTGGGGGCGALPGDGPAGGLFGMIGGGGSDGGAPAEWSGIVPIDVASVTAETPSGRAAAVLVPLDAAGLEAQLFLVFVPAQSEVLAFMAVDDDGTVLGRFELGPVPGRGDGGPMPTPEAPPSGP